MIGVVLVVLLCSCWAPSAAWTKRYAKVTVPRCCPAAHILKPDLLHKDVLGNAEVACVPAPKELPWEPRVYSSARTAFLPSGVMPVHWQQEFSRVPTCPKLRVLSEPNAVLFATSARLMVRYNMEGLPIERFCVDETAALACVHTFKCCDASHIFVGDLCALDESQSTEENFCEFFQLQRELQQFDNDGMIGFGGSVN